MTEVQRPKRVEALQKERERILIMHASAVSLARRLASRLDEIDVVLETLGAKVDTGDGDA